MIEFTPWGKISRLFRDITITEKIDGTNAAIGIQYVALEEFGDTTSCKVVDRGGFEVNGLHNVALVHAQSRSRVITPANDNFGFAAWVWANAKTLIADLGKGLHFGEWWGKGIQRGYGVPDKRLSLFNTGKWADVDFETPNLTTVPVLRTRTFDTAEVNEALEELRAFGSVAAPGFKPAEGVCVFHHASREIFKATIENDDTPKSKVMA